MSNSAQVDTTPVNTTRLRPAKSIVFFTRIWNKPAGEKKLPVGLFQILAKKFSFGGRFVPGEKNFFESVLTSNTKDHMELYPLAERRFIF